MAKKQPNGQAPAGATAAAAARAAEPHFRQIPIDLLLEPSQPARGSLDENKLQELIMSIKQLGIIEPLCVEPSGAFYTVLAGHRRLIAARAIKLAALPCMVFEPGDYSGEAIKHHENKMREDLNAAEEAEYFYRLLESKCGQDVDRLCELVRENRQYVERRLLLIKGDNRVMEALRRHEISMGVAVELNEVKDTTRRMMYLDAAVKGGASVRMVRDWRVRGNAQDELVARPPIIEQPPTIEVKSNVLTRAPECYICHSREDQHDLVILYVHHSCARAVERFQGAAAASAPVPEGEP